MFKKKILFVGLKDPSANSKNTEVKVNSIPDPKIGILIIYYKV